MKYIEASNFGGPEVLRVVEKETPTPGDGMLLVEVKAAGINYGDVMALSGSYPTVTKTPFTIGFEIAGVVSAVGKGVNGFKPGDTVAAISSTGGGYSTHIMIPAATAMPFPPQLDPAIAVGVLVQGLTAYLLLEQAQVKRGDVVLIAAAAGGVGGLAVQLAKVRGAKVIGLASASKIDLVRRFGADYVIDYGIAGWSRKALEASRPQGVRVFLDSIGDLTSEAFSLLGPFGCWVIYGVRTEKQNALPAAALGNLIAKNISVMGFNLEGHLENVPRALGELFRLVIEGRVKVDLTEYPLAEASGVLTMFELRKTTGKLVLVP